MKAPTAILVLTIVSVLALIASPLCGQSKEAATVQAASSVLDEIMAIPLSGIPASMLADAQGIAIVPNVVKGSFVVGIRHGRGVVMIRDEGGGWKPPAFVSLTGGSVGWQAGVQATDVILVFRTRKSVQGLMRGKFTLGADAAIAAGPVGREAAAATDSKLKAEIYSYSRSRGLFLGVSLDGSALQVDTASGAAYYVNGGGDTPAATGRLPPEAARLLEQIARYTGPAGTVPGATARPSLAEPGSSPGDPVAEIQQTRRQLADASQQLYAVLDNNWRTYLALPAEVYAGDRQPSVEALGQSLSRFDAVLKDPRYQLLAQRPEFRSAHDLLKRLVTLQSSQASRGLALPPPPR